MLIVYVLSKAETAADLLFCLSAGSSFTAVLDTFQILGLQFRTALHEVSHKPLGVILFLKKMANSAGKGQIRYQRKGARLEKPRCFQIA